MVPDWFVGLRGMSQAPCKHSDKYFYFQRPHKIRYLLFIPSLRLAQRPAGGWPRGAPHAAHGRGATAPARNRGGEAASQRRTFPPTNFRTRKRNGRNLYVCAQQGALAATVCLRATCALDSAGHRMRIGTARQRDDLPEADQLSYPIGLTESGGCVLGGSARLRGEMRDPRIGSGRAHGWQTVSGRRHHRQRAKVFTRTAHDEYRSADAWPTLQPGSPDHRVQGSRNRRHPVAPRATSAAAAPLLANPARQPPPSKPTVGPNRFGRPALYCTAGP